MSISNRYGLGGDADPVAARVDDRPPRLSRAALNNDFGRTARLLKGPGQILDGARLGVIERQNDVARAQSQLSPRRGRGYIGHQDGCPTRTRRVGVVPHAHRALTFLGHYAGSGPIRVRRHVRRWRERHNVCVPAGQRDNPWPVQSVIVPGMTGIVSVYGLMAAGEMTTIMPMCRLMPARQTPGVVSMRGLLATGQTTAILPMNKLVPARQMPGILTMNGLMAAGEMTAIMSMGRLMAARQAPSNLTMRGLVAAGQMAMLIGVLGVVRKCMVCRRPSCVCNRLLHWVRGAFRVSLMLTLPGDWMGRGWTLRLFGGMVTAGFCVAGRRFMASMPLPGGSVDKNGARKNGKQSGGTKHGKLPRIEES